MNDRNLIDQGTDDLIRLVNKYIPRNINRRAEIYYFIGKELLYLAATLTEDPDEDPIEEVSVSQDGPL